MSIYFVEDNNYPPAGFLEPCRYFK